MFSFFKCKAFLSLLAFLNLLAFSTCSSPLEPLEPLDITRVWIDVYDEHADEKSKIMPIKMTDAQRDKLQNTLYLIEKEEEESLKSYRDNGNDHRRGCYIPRIYTIPASFVVEYKDNELLKEKYFDLLHKPAFHIDEYFARLDYCDISTLLTASQKRYLAKLKSETASQSYAREKHQSLRQKQKKTEHAP